MKPTTPERGVSDTVLFAGIAFVVFLLSLTIIALAFLRPGETFRSSARIKIDFRLMESGFDPDVFRAELRMIDSEPVLRKVVEKLKLAEAFGSEGKPVSEEQALEQLRRILILRPVQNSALIEIQVLSDDSVMAADIANAVVEVYQNDLLDRNLRAASTPLVELENRKTRLSEAAHAAMVVLKQMEITNAPAESLNQQRSALADAERARDEASRELETATREFKIPRNTLQVAIVDRAIPATRPVQTHKRRALAVGIPGSIMLGLSSGAVAVVLRRSRPAGLGPMKPL